MGDHPPGMIPVRPASGMPHPPLADGGSPSAERPTGILADDPPNELSKAFPLNIKLYHKLQRQRVPPVNLKIKGLS